MDIRDRFKLTFEPALLEELEEKSQFVSIKEGQTIVDLGQTIRIIPIILTGSVKILRKDETGKEILLYYVNPNESCAMTFTCCMEQFPSEIKAVAEEDVDFLAIPISLMDQWMMKYPTWKSFVMKTIRNRFNELLKTIDQVAFQKLDERLVNYLKEKSRTTGSSVLNLSHEQIANDLASSREVISRLLKKLENDKKVLLYRSQVKLLRDL
ncbi:MAG TPA: Crp/Fnr family transcriptional regulator [Chitinophagaceae bacterium]|nr:Crp/Fnr family transcriptional regulator [Chitinophagaceae bacterium]